MSIVVALVSPTAAPAGSWTLVGTCGEPHQARTYSYDPASVRREDGDVVVHVIGDYSRLTGSAAKHADLVWSFNCDRRTFVERSRTEYDGQRKVVASYADWTGPMAVSSGSIAEKAFRLVCA